MQKVWKIIKQTYIFILLALIYIPLLIVVIWSFATPSVKGNMQNGFEWNGFNNFIELFQDQEFLNALMNTLIIALIVTPIAVSFATITCYGIWNSSRFIYKSTLSVTNLSIINPEIITGISLTLLFSSTWLALGLNLGLFTLILSHISFCTPYAIIAIYPKISKMPRNLIFASQDLGYSGMKTFFKIVIPYLLPSIIGASSLVFAMSFDDFIITNLVRGRVHTISSEIYLMARGIKMWAITFGALLIFILIIFIVIKAIITYRKEKRKLEQKDYVSIKYLYKENAHKIERGHK